MRMKNNNHPLSWCLINNMYDTNPVRCDETWGVFVELMREHRRVPTNQCHAGEELNVEYVRFLEQGKKRLQAVKSEENQELLSSVQKERSFIKNGPAFLPCTYTNEHRKSDDIDFVYMVVFDSDDGMQYEELLEVIEPWEHVAATSFSDLPEHRKWRVVLPLETPLNINQAAEMFVKFNTLFDKKLDVIGAKKMQLYYLPSCPHDALPEFIHHEGLLLREDDLVDIVLPVQEEKKHTSNYQMQPTDINELTSALAAIPNNGESYDFWLEIGMAIHSEMSGYDGLELWKDWSRQSSKYVSSECDKKWKSFSAHTGKKRTVGTIIYYAKQNNWTRPVPQSEITEARNEISAIFKRKVAQ